MKYFQTLFLQIVINSKFVLKKHIFKSTQLVSSLMCTGIFCSYIRHTCDAPMLIKGRQFTAIQQVRHFKGIHAFGNVFSFFMPVIVFIQ